MFWLKKKTVQETITKHEWVIDHEALEQLDEASSIFSDWFLGNACLIASKSESKDRHGNTLITVEHIEAAKVFCKQMMDGIVAAVEDYEIPNMTVR